MCKVSIIICTYNRSELLVGALESLINQRINKSLYEIIIVDNNSTDKTKEIIDKYLAEANIRYILEPKQGLSHARNTGFRNAKADYAAYIDDDAKADEHWLENIVKTIEEIKPDILGGPIYPFYLTKKPKWFKDKYEIRSNGDRPKYLMAGEYISGSNIIVRKKLLKLFGGFDPKIGMCGNKLSYGEETNLIIKAREKIENLKIYYVPEILIYHLVPIEKMNLKYFIKSNFKTGMNIPYVLENKTSVTKSTKHKRLKQSFNALKIILYFVIVQQLLFLTQGLLFRDRSKYKYLNNYIVEIICPHFRKLGNIYGKLKLILSKKPIYT